MSSTTRRRPPSRPTRPRGLRGFVASLAAFVVVAGLLFASPMSATAGKYPTWQDVVSAKQSQAATAAKVTEIRSLISGLQTQVATTAAAATAAGNAAGKASARFETANLRYQKLRKSAATSRAKAAKAKQELGLLAAEAYRSGGTDPTVELLLQSSGTSADNLLERLSALSKVSQRTNTTYADAIESENTAAALTTQAKSASTVRQGLKEKADAELAAAQTAQTNAQSALTEQQNQQATLNAQLAALTSTTTRTVASYEQGVAAREAARQARIAAAKKAAAEKAARERAAAAAAEAAAAQKKAAADAAAAAAAAANPPASSSASGSSGSSASSSSGGSTSNAAGTTNTSGVSSSGWTKPVYGYYISSGFGARTSICNASYCSSSFHPGVDLAASCGAPIYAAHSGTVSYAGWYYGYGNAIILNNGNGIQTLYGHQVNGGIVVRNGEHVTAGELIGHEGDTGNSFGCHVHYEIRVNGTAVNPIPFMSARGITL